MLTDRRDAIVRRFVTELQTQDVPPAGTSRKSLVNHIPFFLDDLIRELRDAPPGSTTVVATHSNVLPLIVRELGGGPIRALGPDGMLADDDYARVFVLSVGCSTSAPTVELSSD